MLAWRIQISDVKANPSAFGLGGKLGLSKYSKLFSGYSLSLICFRHPLHTPRIPDTVEAQRIRSRLLAHHEFRSSNNLHLLALHIRTWSQRGQTAIKQVGLQNSIKYSASKTCPISRSPPELLSGLRQYLITLSAAFPHYLVTFVACFILADLAKLG